MSRSMWSGLVAAVGAVAATTALIYPLKTVAPAVSMGVLYLIAVLAVATVWGLWLGLVTALASALAFNVFHIPPTGRLHIAGSEDAVALAAYLCSAVAASLVASRAGEAQRRRGEAALKTTLLRTLSHDLRTPLTGIITAGHALRSPSLERREHDDLVTSVVTEATQLSGLVDNLLDLSRLEAGAMTTHTDWCSVEDLVHSAVELVPDAQIAVDVQRDLPLLRVDAAQLERILVNLLENALRHGREPVEVRVRAAGARIQVTVADSGPGLPRDLGDRIFEPYVHANGHQGSGLGLAIVRGFVEANGGRVRAESPARGTVFVVEFPVEAQ